MRTPARGGRAPAKRRRGALLLSPGQLWGLRFMALGAVLVIAAVIGGIVLFVGGDEDGDGDGTQGTQTSVLTQRLTKKDAGLSVFHPKEWKRSERGGIVSLESPDRCVVIALSAPVPASLAGRLYTDTIDQVGRSFGKAQARPVRGAPRIGGAPTQTALLAVRNKQGRAIPIRVSVSRAKSFAHLAEVVFRAPDACPERVAESRAILDSIEYTR